MRKFSEQSDALKSQIALGATGKFPDGKLVPHDEGEIAFRVGKVKGAVVIDFTKPIRSIGMTPQQACQLANSLLKHARDMSAEPLTIHIGNGKS